MDYELCIICQKSGDLHCPLSRATSDASEVYKAFLDDWEKFRANGIPISVSLPLSEATVNNLITLRAKWHKNCRREFRRDKFERRLKNLRESDVEAESTTVSSSSRSSSTRTSGKYAQDTCLFCGKSADLHNVLHSFQKVELTKQIRDKALALHDDNVFTQVSVGDVVANELKYHTKCYATFNRRFENYWQNAEKPGDEMNPTSSKILDEILGMVEEDLAAGMRYFTLKSLYEEMTIRAEFSQVPIMNRTRLKNAINERFHSVLKEERGFRNEVVFVCSTEMKEMVKSSLGSGPTSDDYRILSKAALICRREMLNGNRFNIIRDGIKPDCQKTSVGCFLKYLIGLIIKGPAYRNDFENDQATLSIAQLICHNADKNHGQETPLAVYLGLLIHSKFRSALLVNELNRLGLSINYNRAKYIERKMGSAVLHNFNAEQLVSPIEMRFNLFTVAAVDNFDHDPSARTSKDSFHGTAISLFQGRKGVDDGLQRTFTIPPGAPGKQKLPDDFTTLPELDTAALKRAGPPIPKIITITTADGHLEKEISKEEEWAQTVSSLITDGSPETVEDVKATWSAHHGKDEKEAVPCISGLFPLFKESSSDPRMILHAMALIRKCVNHLNPHQVPVITGDQPVYAIMKKCQWTNESVSNVVVMLGGFHTEKHSMIAIGDILQGSGLTEALVKAGVATSGTADGILKAVHVTKARYAHQVTYVALRKLLHEAYEESSPTTTLNDWLLTQYESPTFLYWVLVMKCQSLVMTFVRAHRQKNFDLYVNSLKSLGELFFACDHYNYARWVPFHVEDMKRLPTSVLEEFRGGNFVVSRSRHRYSSIAIDQSHEQLNKILKGSGGIIGLTEDSSSLLNWSVCGPEVNKRIEEFRIASQSGEPDEDVDYLHHDERVKHQEDFLSDVQSLVDVIRAQGNPFLELGQQLINLEGQISEDSQSVFTLEKTGKEQYANYVKDVVIERTKPIETPIKKNNFLLFKARKQRREQPKKMRMYKDNASVLGKMYIALQSRKGDIDEFFSHEVMPFPPSIADYIDKMYHSNKSDVLVCLQQEVDAYNQLHNEIAEADPSNFDVAIWDGGALIHSLIPQKNLKTFQNYFEDCFLKFIEMELRKIARLDIVWDSYWDSSIKEETRSDRGSGERIKVGPNARLPKNWSSFLRHPANKTDLFTYLSGSSVSTLHLTNCDFYVTNGDFVSHVGPGKQMTEKIDHEEADTKIVLHILHALREGAMKVQVRTVDSDVVCILIHHFNRFIGISPECEIIVKFGTGKNIRLLDIGQMTKVLGLQRSLALPLWVAITGCDSTSSIRGRSKKTSFLAWKKSPVTITLAMIRLMENPFTLLDSESNEFNALETFFINLYGGGAESINKQRKQIFCYKNQNPEMMPPTQDALLQHCRRAVYQASIWASAHKPQIKAPDPTNNGWVKDGPSQRLLPVWMSIPQVSGACQELIRCGCKKKCGNSCSCKRSDLNCTPLCKCPCGEKSHFC